MVSPGQLAYITVLQLYNSAGGVCWTILVNGSERWTEVFCCGERCMEVFDVCERLMKVFCCSRVSHRGEQRCSLLHLCTTKSIVGLCVCLMSSYTRHSRCLGNCGVDLEVKWSKTCRRWVLFEYCTSKQDRCLGKAPVHHVFKKGKQRGSRLK